MTEAVREVTDIMYTLDKHSLNIFLEVARKFAVPESWADAVTDEDIKAHKNAVEEYNRGETLFLSREDFN